MQSLAARLRTVEQLKAMSGSSVVAKSYSEISYFMISSFISAVYSVLYHHIYHILNGLKKEGRHVVTTNSASHKFNEQQNF